MQSKAYAVANGTQAPKMLGENKWLVVRTGFIFQGVINGGDMVPSKCDLPSYSIIGTDKEAIKNRICEEIDDMFRILEMNGEINL